MRNSNCRGKATEHRGTRWEQCALRSSSVKTVDTPEGKNLFHATAMSVYQRQPTMDVRAYLTEAQHLDSYLPPTIIIDGMAVVHELNVHKSHVVIVKAIQHSLFTQLTSLSATARHTYSLMTTAQFAERSYETTKNSWQIF